MTAGELKEKFSKLSVKELMGILDNKFDYTELSVAIAFEELAKRQVSEEDIKEYKDEQIVDAEKIVNRFVFEDLSLFQKNIFYFLWIPPINAGLKMSFQESGMVLKLKQSNYYSILGFIFFILTGIISVVFEHTTLTSIAVWILGFIPAYAFDELVNRRTQIEKLRNVLGMTESEEEVENAED